jgi:hypothetical protein
MASIGETGSRLVSANKRHIVSRHSTVWRFGWEKGLPAKKTRKRRFNPFFSAPTETYSQFCKGK